MNQEIQFILYQLPDDEGKVQVVIRDETIWATQKAMAQLFDVGVPDISKHLKKKFETGELDKEVVVSKMEITTPHGAMEGKTQMSETAFYSLDAIIAVGYRVSSARATKFRQWATKVLKEFIKKGFVLDEERLKQGSTVFGKDYFRELLEKVRSIRASERAARVHSALMREKIEPGTKEAFEAYVACLHQLYLFGAAVQLKRMGYHMERI